MSFFALHNQLPVNIIKPYGNISLSGDYSILNDSSNINITNSDISDLIPSFIINNGKTNIINTNVNNSLPNNIIIDNSQNYIDDQQYNNNQYTFIENGSLFPYSKISQTDLTKFTDINSNDYELIIPINDQFKNNKNKYVEQHGIENFGTGNEKYSTHFLNNGNYGYWGNKFGGQWTSNYTENIENYQDLVTFLTTIPRNLNGYQITINYNDTVLNELNIINLYNGILNINFNNELIENSEKYFNIQNNNLTLNINLFSDVSMFKYNLYDNKDINIHYYDNASSIIFYGDNNNINVYFEQIITGNLEVFKNNSYGNKVLISSNLNYITDDEYFYRRLENNNDNCGNFITIIPYNKKIANFTNDGDKQFDENNSDYMSFTIDEVHPKMIRDVSDIGTIIGWNAKLPIPRGYYVCNGQEIKVDLNNPQDEYYNGQLAYYLNGNLTSPTFTLPNIPAASPSCLTSDINYYFEANGRGANFVPQDRSAKLIYIIKYNNNFQNKKKG